MKRNQRIQHARDSGQLLMFSPTNTKRRKKSNKTKDKKKTTAPTCVEELTACGGKRGNKIPDKQANTNKKVYKSKKRYAMY